MQPVSRPHRRFSRTAFALIVFCIGKNLKRVFYRSAKALMKRFEVK